MDDRSAGRTPKRAIDWPQLGFGAGLRAEHYPDVLEDPGPIEWFEALTENYFETGGRPLAILESLRRDRAVALHGVALSIGGVDPLDAHYLERLDALVRRVEPAIVSDHLCFSSVGGRQLYDLLPLPLTEECLEHVAQRVSRVQDRLGRRILLENPSSYVGWESSTIPEAEFLGALAQRADCGLLLDVNNVYVSCRNMALDPYAYIAALPSDRVGQIHLAGFEPRGEFLFDTHSRPVSPEVWALYAFAKAQIGSRSTMVEWDADIPSYERLCQEVAEARRVASDSAVPVANSDGDVDGHASFERNPNPHGTRAHADAHITR